MMVEYHDPRAEPATPAAPYELATDIDAPLTIGLVANGFPDSAGFLDQVERALGEVLPRAAFRRFDKGDPSVPMADEMLDDVTSNCGAVVAAYGH